MSWTAWQTPPEPVHEGRTLSEWLFSPEYVTAKHHVELALHCMGRSAVPGVNRMLRSGSKSERWVYAQASPWIQRFWPAHRSLRQVRERALTAVHILNWDPEAFAPELAALVADRSEFVEIRVRAMRLLGRGDPCPRALLPTLHSVTNDPAPGVRQAAYWMLQREKERQREADVAQSRFAQPPIDAAGSPGRDSRELVRPLWTEEERGLRWR